jgi:ubiquinone/menaquinone biosynthesis C-methylase UbiE
VELDWGDGDYALIAAALAPTAEVLVDAAEVAAGQEVADIACGTGNVALAAAARGAAATGVDASAPLLEQARRRAAAAGLAARFLQGDAGSLPLLDGAFDAAVSAFGVIFAPDPPTALAEMVRVTRPEGVVALTSWASEGPICEAGGALRDALPADGGDGPAPRWDDAAWVAAELERAGARDVRTGTARVAFTAESPRAWLDEQVAHHPAWRWGRRRLGAAAWAPVRARMLAALEGGNEDPAAFRATSVYLVTVARR